MVRRFFANGVEVGKGGGNCGRETGVDQMSEWSILLNSVYVLRLETLRE